jgi:tyrosine-protein kinase Etk/Wzc
MSVRSTEDLPAFSLHGLLATVRRQAWWMGATTAVGIALTVAITLRQRPVYEARATIRLAEKQNSAPTDVFNALSGPSTIETEMEILRSRSVAEDVVDSLGLRATIVEPKGEPRGNLFGVLQLARDAAPGIYRVQRDTTVFTVTTPDGHSIGGVYGTPLIAAGVEIEPLPLGATEGSPRHIEFSVAPTERAAESVRQGLRVTRPQANAGIVLVAYRSTDPALSAAVVNGVATSYIGRRNEGQKEQYRAAVTFLRTQVQAYGVELTRAESTLEKFSRANSVVDPGAQATDQVRRLADLRVQKEELTARQSELWDLVRRTRQPAESTGDWASFMGSPALLQNQAISAVVQQLSTAEAERARLMTRRTTADPDVIGLDRTISTLRFRLSALATATLQGLDDQARSLERTLSQSGAQLARVPEVQLQYARLRRQVDLHTQLYTLLQTRLNESQISEAMEIANVQLVDPALVPSRPLAARRVFNLLFGSALALLCGIIVAVVRESNDTSVRSRAEMVRLTELPLLAAIPRIEIRNGHRKALAGGVEDRLVIRHSPRSPAAEAYRALRTNVAFATNGSKRQLRTLVVTSPEPEDGKTTTALNLAVTLADQGLKTILVAADQRRPVLHKVLHTERAPGLADLLSGTTTLEQAIRYIPLTDLAGGTLAFIPAGRHVSNPAELLGSLAMKSLLETLSERFDTVILDTPPLCVVTDAAVLGTLADGVLVVARMGSTHSETLQQTVEEIRGLGAHIVGTVLTDVNQREDRYGYRYGYYQYYYEEDGNGNGRQDNGRKKKKTAVRRTRV